MTFRANAPCHSWQMTLLCSTTQSVTTSSQHFTTIFMARALLPNHVPCVEKTILYHLYSITAQTLSLWQPVHTAHTTIYPPIFSQPRHWLDWFQEHGHVVLYLLPPRFMGPDCDVHVPYVSLSSLPSPPPPAALHPLLPTTLPLPCLSFYLPTAHILVVNLHILQLKISACYFVVQCVIAQCDSCCVCALHNADGFIW